MKRAHGEHSVNGGKDDFVVREGCEGREGIGLSPYNSPASSMGASHHLEGPKAEDLKVETGKRSQRDTERRQSHPLRKRWHCLKQNLLSLGRDPSVGMRETSN